MSFVLPDSKGSIEKILYHQTYLYHKDKQIKSGLFENFLKSLNEVGTKPEVYVFRTFRTESERNFLEEEANDWKPLIKRLDYVNINVSIETFDILPYAQDIGLILNDNNPSVIITKSNRYRMIPQVLSKVANLLKIAGLQIVTSKKKFNLEGGYVYSSSTIILYSNPKDRRILKNFKQTPIFIENIIYNLLKNMFNIIRPGTILLGNIEHVDLIFSIFEKQDSYEVFYVDFKETAFNNPIFYGNHHYLEIIFREWDHELQNIFAKIRRVLKNVNFHKIPGVCYLEYQGIYSGANLLFHSQNNLDYAFYLKFPSEEEQYYGVQINHKIETVLRNANITPIAITGYNEVTNMVEIQRSAGLRCLVKVLSRSY
jgi:virulence-associated protein VapD